MKNKLLSALLSVAVAFGLWLYVITAVSPGSKETYYNIPVVLEGEGVLAEKGLMVTARSYDSVNLELSGNRTDLSKVDAKNITVKVDLSKINEPGTQIGLNYTYSFPGNVPSNAFVVESKTPDRLYYNVERRENKDVPVEVRWIGSAAEGFMSDRENKVLDYPVVNISGPESVVEQIEKAIVEVDLTGQRESISESFLYTLCNEADEPVNAELITTNVEQIRLDVAIRRVKDLTLSYTLVEGGGARENNVEITLSLETIRVSGSEAALDVLGDKLNIGTINLMEITKNTTMTLPVTLPEGVKNLTGVTDVDVEIKLTGLASKEFTVQNIVTANIPEGMKVDLITEKLNVAVRGPAAQIAKLTAEDIVITVDFTNAEVGTSTFRGTVSFPEEFEDVGALRVDSVSAAVTGGR